MKLTAFDLAQRYVGIKEIAGAAHHPLIQWWLSLCAYGMDAADEVAWCSAFVNGIAWELRLPRSKSAAARSWLAIGRAIDLELARPGFDVIVLKRGGGEQPGPDVLKAQGHVGFFAGFEGEFVQVLGGNQSNEVNVQRFPRTKVLGVRRLRDDMEVVR